MTDQTKPPGGKPWKGLLASLILWGAGQFFSGDRRRGIIWLAVSYLATFGLLLFYTLTFVPGKAGIAFLLLMAVAWLFMLRDSWRPIKPLRWWGWILLLIASLILSEISSVAAHRLFHSFHVPTESMAPTISPGDDILISRYAYWLKSPKRGDLIVCKTSGIGMVPKDPSGKEIMYDKRIVGLPGDKIEILDPEIRINDVEMRFGDPAHPVSYRHGANYRPLSPSDKDVYIVPDGKYFVLGDNSPNSFDSRYFGPIDREAIYGKIVKIYWPLNRTGTPR